MYQFILKFLFANSYIKSTFKCYSSNSKLYWLSVTQIPHSQLALFVLLIYLITENHLKKQELIFTKDKDVKIINFNAGIGYFVVAFDCNNEVSTYKYMYNQVLVSFNTTMILLIISSQTMYKIIKLIIYSPRLNL